MPEPLDAVMIGAGNRGHFAYGGFALRHPDQIRFVAVAEPDEGRRKRFAEAHGIPPERQFASWEELARQPRLAPVLVNATMDGDHAASGLMLLEAGYHMLLEKPMATTPEQCADLVRAAASHERVLQIGHVLRYAPFFEAIHQIVQSGRLGDIVSVDWRENLVYWHFAHSFVRGRWSNLERSAPMILAKCCHDLDLLLWIFGRRCLRVSSSGSLTHFRADRVGPEIPARCTDGCPISDDCLFDARRLYLGGVAGEFALNAASLDRSPAGMLRSLETGPYGRCVYRCDNDVVDHQVVTLEFDGGLAASLTMQGASHVEGRTVRIDGMRATLLAHQARNEIQVVEHRTGETTTINPSRGTGGHGGGDDGVVLNFLAGVRHDARSDAPADLAAARKETGAVLTSGWESLESHLIAFAAEEARVNGTVVTLDEFRARVGAAGL